jgi:hypothetical protein
MSADNCFNMTRNVTRGDFEPDPQRSALTVHYTVQVDVLDAQYNLVASRTKPKQIQITFTGLTGSSDIEEVADSLVGQSELLPLHRRAALVKVLSNLRTEMGRTRPQVSMLSDPAPKAPKCVKPDRPVIRTDSAPQLAVTLSKAEVDNLLHDALQRIHWGDDTSCLKTLQQLVEISQYDRNLSLIIQHGPLMNTLVNKLKTFASTNLPACICIVSIFEKMSYFSNYQDNIARLKIGAMSLSLLHAQVRLASVASRNLNPQAKVAYFQTQNHLLRLIVSLLANLSESPSAMRKMVHKDIISALTNALDRTSPELVTIALIFLRRIANLPVNWPDVTYDTITNAIATKILLWRTDELQSRAQVTKALVEAIELLYSFSFHQETLEDFKKLDVFAKLANFTRIPELRSPMIKFFYRCSTMENLDEFFPNPEILNMLIAATTSACEERVISLIVLSKLSLDKECAKAIANSSSFTAENMKAMFSQATRRQSQENQILLKMIRNIADTQPNLIDSFDQEIVLAALRNAQNMEALVDIFAIASRAKMNSTRAKFFSGNHDFVGLIVQILSNQRALPQLHLEIVMFISGIALYSEAAKALGTRIVDCIVDAFMLHQDDLDIQTQCLFAFCRFICHTDSRAALTKRQGIIQAVIKHSASRNSTLNGTANAALEALGTFDKEWKTKIRQPRYQAFNQEWIRSMAH